MYKSVELLNRYNGWILLLLSGAITFRCLHTLLHAYLDSDFPAAWKRCKLLLLAGIVGICVGGVITFIEGYYSGGKYIGTK